MYNVLNESSIGRKSVSQKICSERFHLKNILYSLILAQYCNGLYRYIEWWAEGT